MASKANHLRQEPDETYQFKLAGQTVDVLQSRQRRFERMDLEEAEVDLVPRRNIMYGSIRILAGFHKSTP
ncbi:hypothetical protein [Lichenifustis flavocetrariae]|uniref:Uncharacterized protein n=1 Tax=Lichenifustis flavocetrariae TaxID=2949735 RepID=A0AA41Z3A5_9HYPH|nr:hypothetical protein [Lichenifustis flavocetrariae]MCW6509565.1 hypothetical protein [Lichenifustis flavocetrariae]